MSITVTLRYPLPNQVIDESGFAAAHINDGRGTITRDTFN
jgi:hypothetical protein